MKMQPAPAPAKPPDGAGPALMEQEQGSSSVGVS